MRFFYFTLGLLLSVGLSQLSSAQEPSQGETLKIKDLRFDLLVPKEVRLKVIGDLGYMSAIKHKRASPAHTRFFGPDADGQTYLNFILSRIHRVAYNRRARGVIAYVKPDQDPHKLWLTPSFMRQSFTRPDRLATYIHEAMHAEEKHRQHDTCPAEDWISPHLIGRPDCDWDENGPYGVSAAFLFNMAAWCKTCSKEDSSAALEAFMENYNRIGSSAARERFRAEVTR